MKHHAAVQSARERYISRREEILNKFLRIFSRRGCCCTVHEWFEPWRDAPKCVSTKDLIHASGYTIPMCQVNLTGTSLEEIFFISNGTRGGIFFNLDLSMPS